MRHNPVSGTTTLIASAPQGIMSGPLKKDSGGHTEIGGPRSDSACRWSPQSWPLHCGPAAEHVEPHGIGDGNPARASASWLEQIEGATTV
jgi:hypothetical protein